MPAVGISYANYNPQFNWMPPLSYWPNETTTGCAAGGFPLNTLTPVNVTTPAVTVSDSGNPSWVQVQGDGSLLIQGVWFTYVGPNGVDYNNPPDSYFVEVQTTGATPAVTFRGCKFTGYNQTCLHVENTVSNLLVTYCEFSSPDPSPGHRLNNAIGCLGSHIEFSYNHIYWYCEAVVVDCDSTAASGNYWNIHDNYIHDSVNRQGYSGISDHTDGIGINGGRASPPQHDLTIHHNRIENPLNQTDCIISGGPVTNKTITDNLFVGGGYTIYGGYNGAGTEQVNYVVRGNYFSTRFYPLCGYAGYAAFDQQPWGSNGNTWEWNWWYDGPNALKNVPQPTGL